MTWTKEIFNEKEKKKARKSEKKYQKPADKRSRRKEQNLPPRKKYEGNLGRLAGNTQSNKMRRWRKNDQASPIMRILHYPQTGARWDRAGIRKEGRGRIRWGEDSGGE